MHVHMHMQLQSQKAPNWQNLSELASSQHYCAYATGCTDNRGLLTEQAFSLSEERLFRQQAFASSCGTALAAWLLLC